MERKLEGGLASTQTSVFMGTLLLSGSIFSSSVHSGFYESFVTYLLHDCCNFIMTKTEVENRINRA